MKRFHLLLACSAMLGVFACSDSSSNADSDDVDTDNGSSAVSYNGDGIFYYEKETYEIDTEKSVVTLREPVCEERKGELYWSLKGEESVITYKYNSSSKSINATTPDGEKSSLKYYGKNFPVGHWITPDAENSIYEGMKFGDDGEFAVTFYFADSCYVDNLNALTLFDTKDLGDNFDTDDLKKKSCKEVDVNGVVVTVNSYKAGKFSLTYTYGKLSCEATFTPRYPTNEDDCKAAYMEYKNDKDAEDEFDFDDYVYAEDSDASCFDELIAAINK